MAIIMANYVLSQSQTIAGALVSRHQIRYIVIKYVK